MKARLAELYSEQGAYKIGLVVEYADQYNFTVFAGGTTWKYQSGIDADGNKYWYLNGKRHRTDGPAVVGAHGAKCWYLNGKRHRTDGPAVVYASGAKHWYLNDKELSEAEWEALTSS
jgi:hypothetical protein